VKLCALKLYCFFLGGVLHRFTESFDNGRNLLLFHFIVDFKATFDEYTIFNTEHADIAGTKYNQMVLCICYEQGTEIHPSLPKVIN